MNIRMMIPKKRDSSGTPSLYIVVGRSCLTNDRRSAAGDAHDITLQPPVGCIAWLDGVRVQTGYIGNRLNREHG